jgi:hypothetical protein
MFGWIQSGYSNVVFSNVNSNDLIIRTNNAQDKIIMGTGRDSNRNATMYLTNKAVALFKVPASNAVFEIGDIMSVTDDSNIRMGNLTVSTLTTSNIISSAFDAAQLTTSNLNASNIAAIDVSGCNVTATSNVYVGTALLPTSNLSATLGSACNRFQDLWIGGNSFHIGDVTMSQNSNGDLRIVSNDGTVLKNMITSGVQFNDVNSNPLLLTRCNNEGPLQLYKESNGELVLSSIIENLWSSNQNIGIGTSNPSKLLDINGDAIFRGKLSATSGVFLEESNTFLNINPDSTYSNIAFKGTNVHVLNNFGIGVSNPEYSLDVPAGIARLNNLILAQNQLPFLIYNDYANIEQTIPSFGIAVPSSDSNTYISGKYGLILLTSNHPVVIDPKTKGLGIKTSNVNGMLQFAEGNDPRKIVLSETANNNYQVTSIGTMGSNLIFQVPGSNGHFKFYVADDDTSTTDIFSIQGNGNVKIGSTSLSDPVNKFEVDGNAKLSGRLLLGNTTDTLTAGRVLAAGNTMLQSGDTMSISLGKNNTDRNQAEIAYKYLGDNNMSNVLKLGHTGQDVLSITGYGGVGIGTETPNYELDVRGSVNVDGSLITKSNLSVGQKITAAELQSLGTLSIGTDSNTTTINIGGSASNSNVTAINIGGPGDTVNIQGDVTYINVTNTSITDNTIRLNTGGSNTVDSGFEIEQNGSVSGYFKVNSNENGYLLKAPLSSNLLSVVIGSNCQLNNVVHMSYSNSNVGIGTISSGAVPYYSLHVVRDTSTSLGVETLSNDSVLLTLENSNVRWGWTGPIFNSNNALQLNVTDKNLANTSNAYLTITSDGLIGIGTDNPTYALDVNGTINATGVLVNGQQLTGGGGGGGGTSAGWAVAGSNIYTDCNLGIKKSNPFYALDVNGVVNATEFRLNGQAMSAGYWQTSNAVMYSMSNVGIGLEIPQYTLDVGGTINATSILVNGQNISSGFWQINGGNIYSMCNVGIGTVSPARRLDIVGDGRVTGNFTTTGSITTNTLTVTTNLDVGGSLTIADPISITSTQWGDGIVFNNGNNRIYTNDDNSTFVINVDNTSNLDIKSTDGTSLMRINGSNGNIGIGNSNPTVKLSVIGAISATSYCNMTWSMIAARPTFATVATSGSYNDLADKPALCNVALSGRYVDLIGAPSLTGLFATQSWNDLLNKPTFATVASTGNYADLSTKPNLCNLATTGSWDDLYDIPANLSAIANNDLSNFANTVVLQQKLGVGVPSPVANVHVQGSIMADTYCNVSYNDLTNKPALCNVATTANFTDLRNIPSLSYFTNDVRYFSCNVGIKVINPEYALHVQGAVSATSYCNIDWSMIANTPPYSRPVWSMLEDAPSNLSFFVNDLSNFGTVSATTYCNLTWAMVNNKPSFCNIATTGSWSDLVGRPSNLSTMAINDLRYFGCNVGFGELDPQYPIHVNGAIYATSYCNLSYLMIPDVPTLATVATSGYYADLLYAPTNLSSFVNDLSNFDASNVTFKTVIACNYSNVSWEMIQNKPTLFDGNYNSLSNLPTLATIATTGAYSNLIGAPTLCNVATTASYADLRNRPNLASVAFVGSNTWSNLDGKPVFANVAYSGSYLDLGGRPTHLSSFSNDLTSFTNITTSGSVNVATDLTVNGNFTMSNSFTVDGGAVVTGVLKTSNLTTLDNSSVMNIAGTSNVSTVNLGVCNDVAHVINIANGNGGSAGCNVIFLGGPGDYVHIPGVTVSNYWSSLYTSNYTFTLNVGGPNAAGAGIFIQESNNSNAAYWKVSSDRNSFLLRTPTSTSEGVWDMSGDRLFINGTLSVAYGNSNVGVGTSNPIDKFHIQQGHMRMHNTNDVISRSNAILFSHVNSNTVAKIESFYKKDGNNTPYVDLRLHSTSNSSMKHTMTLSDGMVGIGTSNPNVSLHVSGDISMNKALCYRTENIATWSNGQNKVLDVPYEGMLHISAPNASNANPVITLSNQMVAIGKSNPSYTLDVLGGTIGTTSLVVNSNIQIGSNDVNNHVPIGTMNGSTYTELIGLYGISNTLMFGTSNQLVSLDVQGDLAVQGTLSTSNISSCNINALSSNVSGIQTLLQSTSNQAYSVSGKWTIQNSNTYYTLGFVGIGTSNPTVMLDVQGAVRATSFCNVSYNDIVNKPTLSLLAYDGSNTYSNIIGTPTLAPIATSGSWTDISGRPSFATIATTGAWADVVGRPTSLLDFTNNLSSFTDAITFRDSVTCCNKVAIGKNVSSYDLDVNGTINACNILINGQTISSTITAGYWQTLSTYQASVSNVIIGANTFPIANLHAAQDVAITACNAAWTSLATKGLYMRYSTNGTDDAAYIQSIDRTQDRYFNMFIQGSNISIGNANTTTPTLHVRFNGRVGIGTSNPTQTLDVNGSINATSYCNVTYAMIQNTPSLSVVAYSGSNTYDNISGKPNLSVMAYTGSNTWANILNVPSFAAIAYDGAWSNLQGTAPALSTFTNDLNTFNQLVTFNSNIQFANGSENRKIVLASTASNAHQFMGLGTNANLLRFQIDASTTDFGFFAGSNTTTSTELVRIRGTGNMGVGTPSPSTRLHVSGGSGVRVDGNTNTSVSIYTNDNSLGSADVSLLKTNGEGFRMKNFMGSNAMTIAAVDVGGNETNRIWISTNVGIKTTNPTADFHVNGTIFATSYSNIQWSQIMGIPSNISSPFSGSYTDLTNKPTLLSSFTNDLQTFNQNIAFSCNVGIGVGSATCALDVSNGDIKCSTLTASNISLSNITSTAGTMNIGSDNGTSTINIGCATSTPNTINIANTSPATNINIGSGADTIRTIGTRIDLVTPNLATTGKLITLNSSGVLESGGSAGFQIFENSNATGYFRVSADRTSFEMKTPLGSQMTMDLTNNAVNINNNSLFIGSGQVGIGTNTPTQALEVVGSIRCASYLTTSDARLKKNIQKIENPLEKLKQIDGVYYDWKNYTNDKNKNVGVLAQQVASVLPEAVSDGENGMAVNYQSLIALLINAVNEQQVIIEDLKQRVECSV